MLIPVKYGRPTIPVNSAFVILAPQQHHRRRASPSHSCNIPLFLIRDPGSESSPTNVVGVHRGEFIFENFVPHGYAFAQVAVFAPRRAVGALTTGVRGGPRHTRSRVARHAELEQWKRLYGKSYEGATQWSTVMGSEYLKTIVPMSGTTALHPLLYKNGSAEARSQIMHMNYFSSTVTTTRTIWTTSVRTLLRIFAGQNVCRRRDGPIHAELLRREEPHRQGVQQLER